MPHAAQRIHISVAARIQWAATGLVLLAAIAIAAITFAGALGWAPVLRMPLQFGETVFPSAGLAVQGGLALLMLAIAACMPSGLRVLALERSHRDFQISMSDVAQAYRVCHAADRAGTFTLSEQFDAVKERLLYLRRHPDLGHLEPDVLESAAEMSYASRELAETYSDENVARARGFLAQRHEEILQFESRIERAVAACRDLKREREAVLGAEDVQEGRLTKFVEEYGDLLAELGFKRGRGKVVSLPPKPVAAE